MYLHHVLKRQTTIPSIYRCYSTVSIDTSNLKPVQTIQEKDGITEIFVVNRSTLKKKKKTHRSKIALSKRLRETAAQPGWTRVPDFKQYERVEPPNVVPVATLAHGLEKVLFNPGVHYLKDPRTKHFNYSPYLENITQPVDFNFEALQPYITSSKDKNLIELARSLKRRYIGSTSSISAVLSHFYFVMSHFRPVNISCLSHAFEKQSTKFTRGTRTAASIYLRWKDGVYAIDVDKSYDVEETVLSMMGKSLEKVLTLEPSAYERYLKESGSQITDEERNQPESFAYGKYGKFLLRSQLDCYDSRLPRGTFDLKTRAAMPIRLDIRNYTDYLGYSLKHAQGLYESFEREYYDMIRSAFLKYSFQVRIGHMDGILVAYHNTRKIFGFQYISREEMDSRLFGSSKVGNRVFENALFMFETVLNEATKKYPNQTLRLSFDTKGSELGGVKTNVFVETVPEQAEEEGHDVHDLEEFFQTNQVGADNTPFEPYPELSMYELKTQSFVNGQLIEGPLNAKSSDTWAVDMQLNPVCEDDDLKKRTAFRTMRKKQASVYLPSNNNTNPHLKRFKDMSDKVLQEETHIK